MYPFRPWEKTVATKLRSGPVRPSGSRSDHRHPRRSQPGRQGVDLPKSVHGGETNKQAEFEASEANEGATLALCDLLEEADRGRMTSIELASRLRELTEAAPEHIDARAHLGSVLLESEQLQEAAAEYERAFEIGSKALPTDFDGRIEWIRLDNRPFLRAAYGLALVRLKTGKRTEAIRLMEQLLRWNPNDNQGVRLSIGSEYLRAGHRTKASKVLRCQRSPESGQYDQLVIRRCMTSIAL